LVAAIEFAPLVSAVNVTPVTVKASLRRSRICPASTSLRTASSRMAVPELVDGRVP
jgi:hypothetical protein